MRILIAVFFVLQNLAWAQAPMSVQLFDAISNYEQRKLVPEDNTQHRFRGDVVVTNGKIALALRHRGAELYTGTTKRAELVAVGKTPAISLSAVKIIENNPSSVALDATFKTAKGESLTVGYELKVGQVFVETRSRSGATALRVMAPCRFAVLPDFFADDFVVDAATIAAAEVELPSENFLMHLLGDGQAIVTAVWHPAQDDVRIKLSGATITHSEIPYGKNGKVSVAVLNSPGVWHHRDIARDEADKIIHLDWKAPFAAHWRVDWRRDDQLTDSWEMLSQKPGGEYVKHGWYGQPESFGNIDWLKDGRKRWTTVLGSFQYPCWLDKNGEGYLQPLKKGVHFQGPALIYPISRIEATPLEEFTLVDIMRATLGVGPCEYILDIEGQKKRFQGRPTCASRTILDDIYGKKEQKTKKDEVQKTLDEVLAFVRHIRGRIGDYVTFGHDMDAYLAEQKGKHPELADLLAELQTITGKIDAAVAKRKDGIKTPEDATQLVNEFRTTLVDYEGDDALAKCKKITAALVKIGGSQDELVGECRMIIKQLRQRAATAMTTDLRVAPIAVEVRRRTQQMLRNPTSYEAPRH